MFHDENTVLATSAQTKLTLLNENPLGYFVSAMLAGGYVALAIFLIYVIGGLLDGSPANKIVMGVSFGIGLSLVIMAGSELFTGNTLVFAMGVLHKTVRLADAARVLLVCHLGNWAGAIVVASLFFYSGQNAGATGTFVAKISYAKMTVPLVPLIMRAILCNILVCLATWCSYKLKSESAKLIIVFWCLFGFITSGYEHSVANMSLLTVGLLEPAGYAVSLAGYFYNILVVTFGNMIGGIVFLALPYYAIAANKRNARETQ